MLARRIPRGGSGGFPPNPDPPLIALYNGQPGAGDYSIGAASRASGGTWTPYVSNPVLTKGAGGTWEDGHVKDPLLLHDGSQYVMYYSGYDGAAYRIGRATASAHTGSWTKYGSNPVLGLGSGGSFDDERVIFPTVLYEPADTGREWKMWYTGLDGSKYRIGYAYSSDGLSWTKFGQVVDVGSGGTWDDEGCVVSAIYKEGATYNLFYGGSQRPDGAYFWQAGLVTFTDPEGTYTKSGSNPILQPRNLTDPDSSQALTSTTASGSATVVVGDTSHWSVGEPVVLADDNSETCITEIASIDSGTQVTLANVTTSAFTSANGARLRPFSYLSVQPRTVRQTTTGYEMFLAVFQPVGDLTVGGEALREGSMRATASALTGPWSFDYTTGLMFPMYPANTGWDQFSAENPSVIAG